MRLGFAADAFPPDCEHWWVATAGYTAHCPSGLPGASVFRSAQGRSNVSFEDAKRIADCLARELAEGALVCGPLTSEETDPFGLAML